MDRLEKAKAIDASVNKFINDNINTLDLEKYDSFMNELAKENGLHLQTIAINNENGVISECNYVVDDFYLLMVSYDDLDSDNNATVHSLGIAITDKEVFLNGLKEALEEKHDNGTMVLYKYLEEYEEMENA